jgi:hypothetical protein
MGTTSATQPKYDSEERHTSVERLGSAGGDEGRCPFKLLFLPLPRIV